MPKRVGVEIIMWFNIRNVVHKTLVLKNCIIDYNARYV